MLLLMGEKNASEDEFNEVLLEVGVSSVVSSPLGDLEAGLRRRRRSGVSSLLSALVVVANDDRLLA